MKIKFRVPVQGVVSGRVATTGGRGVKGAGAPRRCLPRDGAARRRPARPAALVFRL